MTRILFGQDARQILNRSLQRSVRAATAALGPDGRTIIYDRAGQPTIALSGFEVAREAADEAGLNSISPRILKEVLAEAQRELGGGAARLACVIGGAFDKGIELVQAGSPPRARERDAGPAGRSRKRMPTDSRTPSAYLRSRSLRVSILRSHRRLLRRSSMSARTGRWMCRSGRAVK